MSSASLQHDPCSYQEKLKRSIGPGMYMLGTPASDCDSCGRDIPNDPHLRWQSWGPGFCEPGSTVDTGSELLGLNYKNTKCAADQYLPGSYQPKGGVCAAPGNQPVRECSTPTESTRLSNPPCTLRCTGWNRWEWLCWDPQDTAVVPFDYLVSNRILMKDNHVPCIPSPPDQTNELGEMTEYTMNYMERWQPPENCGAEAPGSADAAVSYRNCKSIKAVNAI